MKVTVVTVTGHAYTETWEGVDMGADEVWDAIVEDDGFLRFDDGSRVCAFVPASHITSVEVER